MRVDLFDFDLPPDLIAERPMEPREAARLLHVGQDLADRHIRDLPALLGPQDLLVFNDTRVIPARLHGMRDAVAVEILLHQRMDLNRWRAFAKPGKRLKPGQCITFSAGFAARVADKEDDGQVILAFEDEDGAPLAGEALVARLEAHGEMPLPPYIRRAQDARDKQDYQTIFAAKDGAVAAPTAGLHFTPGLMEAIRATGATVELITLHVGAGTFLPVKADDTADHKMHWELGELSPDTAQRINAHRAAGGRLVAVGTTSLRLLESAAAEDGTLHPFSDATNLFITPGYRFRAVDRLFTNFHLPKSTLFMLVSAFSGLDRMRAAYAHAIAGRYRFFSYGDACLLERAA